MWLTFQNNAALQRTLGVSVRLLDRQAIRTLIRQLRLDDVLGATHCPTDGYADPGAAVSGFIAGARRSGVYTCAETAVTGIELCYGRVAAVKTDRGSVRTLVVVTCAGAWAAKIGRMVGLRAPQSCRSSSNVARRQCTSHRARSVAIVTGGN